MTGMRDKNSFHLFSLLSVGGGGGGGGGEKRDREGKDIIATCLPL